MTTSTLPSSALDRADIIKRLRAGSSPAQPIATGTAPRLHGLSGIRGVIFDVYGTLFVSAVGDIGHTAGNDELRFRAVLAEHGYPLDAGADVSGIDIWRERIRQAHATAIGRGIAYPEIDIREIWAETLDRLQAQGAIPPLPRDKAAIERLAIDYETAVNPVWPMPDALTTLKALKSMDVHLGIVSNAQFFTPLLFDALLQRSLDTLGFESGLCVWSYQCREAKPSQRLFRKLLDAAADLGIRHAHELLYVGNDMLNDVWTASQSGLRTALFAGDRRSLRLRTDNTHCRALQPDLVLTQLADLAPLISKYRK